MTFSFLTGRGYLRRNMDVWFTVVVLMQLLPAGIYTQSSVTNLTAEPTPTPIHPSPTVLQPSTTTQALPSMKSSTSVSSLSLVMTNATSVIAPGSTSEVMPSMTSRGIPESTLSSVSSMTSIMPNQTLSSSSLSTPLVTEPTLITTITPSPPLVISTNIMTSPSINVTSTSKPLSPSESLATAVTSLSINATSTTSTTSMTSLINQTMSSAVTIPTTYDVTTPTAVSVTPTPALNVTLQPSIYTTPSMVENITSSSMMLDNVTSVNMTITVAVTASSITQTNVTYTMSTSVAPVTTTTAPTTTQTTTTAATTEPPSTTNSFMVTYWTVTDIKVPVATNVSGDDFLNLMETGLAKIYVKAYSRKRDIDAGSFNSRRRKRRRRAVTEGDITITMQDVKRDQNDPELVSMIYTVEKAKQPVPSAANAETINLVSDQEMAIQLRYIVTKKAKPLNWVEPVTTTTTVATTAASTENNTQVWIIAVVAGGVAILIVIAIVGLCIATKKKKSGVDEEAEPKLMNLKNAPLEDDEEDIGPSISKYSNMENNGSSSNLKVQSPKKQSYEINSDTQLKEEEKHLYAEVKKPKKPDLASRIGKSKGSSQDGLESKNMAEDAELIESPKKKKGEKGRRKHKRKDGDLEDDEREVVTKTIHPASLLVPESQPLTENAYYSAEEEDELKKRKAAERKKNKQRIREKKKKEKHHDKSADQLMVEYLAAQEEIDTVLEAPTNNKELPDVFVHKKKRGSKSTLEGHDNMALTAEESLQVARSRMHELLDDAFSLISPSTTSITQNQPPEDEGFHSPRTQSPRSRSLMLLNQRSYDVRGSSTMKHSPIKMESYKGDPILQTWSPYRAADQVALISMPNKMQTSVGRTPSGRTKRPAADLMGKKSKDSIPKPAFLKSRDLMSNKGSTAELSSTKSQNGDLASKAGKGKSEDAGEQAEEAIEIPQPNNQFEDTEISKENSMLPSIRDRKLAKAAKKRAKNGGGGIEMKTLNGKVGQKHKEPFKSLPNGEDEMDIITRSIQSAVTPASTVNSIRNEIKSGLPDKNVVTSFSGPGRNSRASGSLVDIA